MIVMQPCKILFINTVDLEIVQRKTFMISFDWLVTVIPALMFT
jgi:hypothetical protein